MSVVPHDMSFEPISEPTSAPMPAKASVASRVFRVARWLPRVVLNGVLIGLFGLVVMLMCAPGYIEANERTRSEFRRPPGGRSWWSRPNHEGRQWPGRPERPSQR